MNRYIDIHCHTNFAAYDLDRDEVIARAHDAQVALINVGTQKDTSKSGVELAQRYDRGVYATVGLHPIHTSASFHDADEIGEETNGFTSRGEVFDMSYYETLARDTHVVAIGECGLDYFHTTPDFEKKQRDAFEMQIQLAQAVVKPLMLHVRNGADGRNAYRDVCDMLAQTDVVGNVHFFAGSQADAQVFLDKGYTLSFTGVITFAKEYEALVQYVPLDMMHAETDAPYVTPKPHRGRRNEPIYVREVVQRIADIKHLPLEQVQEVLWNNARRVFGDIEV